MQVTQGFARLACLVGAVAAFSPWQAAAAAPAENKAAGEHKAVARAMVQAGLVAAGDKVQISGSVRDHALLEDLAIETLKVGAHPLITVGSQQLGRRSYDEVPASFDSKPPVLDLALVNVFDVLLSVDVGDADGIMAGVPPARIAARASAGLPVFEAFLKKGVRMVNLGNGLYPTADLAKRLGKTQAELSSLFWKAVTAAPEPMRAKGEALRAALAAARQITLTSANGTHLTFGVVADKGFVSDGRITPDRVKLGGVATQTWLPAGELGVPASMGSAEGKVVIDKLNVQGTQVEALTLVFSKGKLTSMSAKTGLPVLKALYEASTGGKDQFGYLDLGLNSEAKLPTNAGRVIWMAPGGVTIGLGDNTGWGGSNTSNFGLSMPVSAATLTVDGKALIKDGVLQ